MEGAEHLPQGLESASGCAGASLSHDPRGPFHTSHRLGGGDEPLQVHRIIRESRRTSTGRDRYLEEVVGYFVNPVVLRADLTGDPRFTAFLPSKSSHK